MTTPGVLALLSGPTLRDDVDRVAAAAAVVVALLLTSNDFSLKRLKHKRWKAVQRWSYVFALLTAAHGFLYQAVENRLLPFGLILSVVMLWILSVQLAGFRARRADSRIK